MDVQNKILWGCVQVAFYCLTTCLKWSKSPLLEKPFGSGIYSTWHVKILKSTHYLHALRLPFNLQGNVEIETYWLKGKRDKDGNAQAACPQFEAQTISKAAISAAEPPIDEEELV